MPKTKCEYPNCPEEIEYLNSAGKHLCHTHYELCNFICEIVWSAPIEINPYKSRFQDNPKEGKQP
jgi:hypothetical protein